jgi:hypothetical protein
MRIVDRDSGSERWVEVRALPVADAAGSVQIAVNIMRDVTGNAPRSKRCVSSEENLQREHSGAPPLREQRRLRGRMRSGGRRTAPFRP